jgi:MFS family permease
LIALTLSQEVLQSEETILSRGLSARHSFLGLNNSLWRVALVAGIAQLSASIWTWQFAISLDSFLIPWQIGLVFAAGTLAGLVGYTLSGALADAIGRKMALLLSFIPQIVGLLLLYLIPFWPLIIIAYSLQYFGWSFVLVISRTIPADDISTDIGPNETRKITMVLMPAYAVDAISPILAVLLLQMGLQMYSLLLLGAIAAVVAMVLTALFVHDAYNPIVLGGEEEITKNPVKGLGNPFWKFTVAMLGYYSAWGMAIPYLGILSINEWGASLGIFGLSSSVFSIVTVLLMYTLSGVAGQRTKMGLFLSLVCNSIVMIVIGLGSGIWLLMVLNGFWAAPIIIWTATEGVLIVNGVPADMKGTALGLFSSTTSATGLFAAPLGALVWSISGSLRFLWILSGTLAVGFAILAWWALKRVKIHSPRLKNVSRGIHQNSLRKRQVTRDSQEEHSLSSICDF